MPGKVVLLSHHQAVTGRGFFTTLLNGEVDIRFRERFHNYVFMPQCLIVARLAGNPHFEEMVVKLGSTDGWYANGKYKESEWPKLVEYLRNEVKPLV